MLDFGGSRYYDIPQYFLSWIGLWPEENIKIGKARRILSLTILISALLTMLSFFVIYRTDFQQLFNLVSCSFLLIAFVVKYGSFCVGIPQIIEIMRRIKVDWDTLQCEGELLIIENYMENGIFITKLGAAAFMQCIIMIALCSLLPFALMLINPVNRHRRLKLPLFAIWFEERYYYIAAIYSCLLIFVGGVTLIGTEALFVMFVHHACGMFSIACYRAKRAVDQGNLSTLCFEETCTIYDNLISAIMMHQRAINFADVLSLTFMPGYAILLVLGVSSLSVNLFRVVMLIVMSLCFAQLSEQFLVNDGWRDLGISILFVFGHFVYMFCGTYIGQHLINDSLRMFIEIYDTKWYRTSLSIKKLLLIIMQRSMKSCTLEIGGVFFTSLDGFTKLMSMSFSYFTFMYKMR